MAKKRKPKYWTGKIHLWLGLTSGLIVLLLSVTGCIYVFSQEITAMQRHEHMYAKNVTPTRVPVTTLWKNAQGKLGKKNIYAVAIYNDPARNVEFRCYQKNPVEHFWYFDNIDYFDTAYVDPYTGQVVAIYDEEADFFNIIKMLHWSLLMNDSIGQTVTGVSTLIFVVMLITGLILWWPKNKAARKQRVWFQWKESTKWRRKNYDLHNILGFYISGIALIIALTGLVWAFTWFQSLVYVAGSGSVTPPDYHIKQSTITPGDKDAAFEKAYHIIKQRHGKADAFQMSRAANDSAAVTAYIQQYKGVYYVSHSLQFDQYSGKLLHERMQNSKNFGEKLISANYDIHVGAILGIPGKIIAFIASFTCAMLPITGFLIWRGRTKKEKKTAVPQKTKIG